MKQFNQLFFLALLVGLNVAGYASDIVEVIPLTDRIIMVHFDDGYVRHHQKGEARTNEWVIQDPLNIALATQLGSYSISSTDDPNFGGGVQPTDIGRKSKGTDFTWLCQDYNDEVGCINSDADHAKEHWVYLYLDNPLQAGSTYTITTGDLATNGNSYELRYDPKLASSRSEAVHVNIIGYAPTAPKKYGYVYHWAGDKGGLDLSPYAGATFWLVNTTDNSVAYTGAIAFRKAANNVETGQPDDTPDDNFLGAEVYEADFSDFATPGEYRLAVEGIGSSFPFVIDDDAYFEPYYNIVRSLYHQRSGIALEQPYTKYTRPAPHNPNVTPGFEGMLQYTTSRFVDWEEEDHSDNDKPAIEAGILGPLDTYGWYQDAADWDGYFSHLRIPSWLLFLYEFAPTKYPDNQLNIPESGNGVPDLVDEAAWLPRFFHRTRQELIAKGYGTGGVGSRVAGDWFGGDGEGVPSYEDVNRTYIVSGEDPFTTYKYAATAAHLAIALQKAGSADPEGVDWLQEATEAYAWAQANTRDGDEEPVFGLRLSDQRLYAAAALYKLTGEEVYHDQVKADAASITSGTILGNDQRWGVYTYLTMGAGRSVEPGLYANLRDAALNSADNVLTDVVERRATRYGGNFFFPMLVGQPTTPMIFDGLMGFMLTKDSNPGRANNYLTNIYTTSDYFLGTNPLNTAWATGLGERHPDEVFHLDSWYNGLDTEADEEQTEFYPGIVPYGPWINDGQALGPWDHDWAGKTTFPAYETWPGHERWYNQRTAPTAAEFTIHQNTTPAAVTYGFLIDGDFGNFSTGSGAATALTLTPDSLRLTLNSARQLTLTITPANADGGLTWSTSDPTIATIDRNGIVTGVGLGTTVVSVASADGSVSDSTWVQVGTADAGITYVVADFDEVVPTNGSVEPGRTQMFGAGGTISFVENPDPDSNNESAQVAQFDREAGTYKLFGFNLAEPLPASPYDALRFQLYGTGITQVFVTVADQEGNNLLETQQSVTVPNNVWSTIEIDIPETEQDNIKEILIFPNPINEAEATLYVDNVQLVGNESPVVPSGVAIAEDSVTVAVGATTTLIATVLPEEATERALLWQSMDESIAQVNAAGEVSGVSEGIALVSVTTVEGGFEDSVYVTVVPGGGRLIIADFDEVVPTNGNVEPGRTQMFSSGGTLAIIDNPDATADNASGQVAQFDKPAGTFQLIGFNLPEAVPVAGYQTFSFQLYGTNVTEVYVALDDADGNRVAESFQSVSIDGTWGTVTLELPEGSAAAVKSVLIFPNPNNEAAATFFVDNVRMDGTAPEPPPATRSLIIADFDEVIPTNGVVEPGRTQMFVAGGTTTIVSNPDPTADNASDQVAQFDKGEGTYKLIGFSLPEAVPLAPYQALSLQFYGELTQVFIILNDANGDKILERFIDVAISNTWGTVTLDLPDGLTAAVKDVLIFPNPNDAGSATFFVDNVRLDGAPDTAPEVTIVVSPENVSLEEGASATLSAEVSPAEADTASLVWSSSSPIVASVDENGMVTGLTPGSAFIIATTAAGTATDSAVVNVVPGLLEDNLIVADFDDVIPTLNAVEPGITQAFVAGGEITQVANPEVNAANPSDQVLRFDKQAGTFKLVGFNLQVGRSLNRFKTFSFQVYGDDISEVLLVMNGPTGAEVFNQTVAVNTEEGPWGVVKVDIPEGTTGTVKDILIFPNPTVEAAGTYFFDNVRFNGEEPITYPVGDCVLTEEDFPEDVGQIIAVTEVPYFSFRRRGSYMVGLVTGIRSDGRAGAWEIHNDCSIKPMRKSGFRRNTSLLPDVRGVDRRYGWRYEPTGISADGKYIEAIAINDEGYTHPRGWQVEAGTMVDVRFRVAGSRLGRIFLVIGQVSCDKVVAKRKWFDYFVIRCDDSENARSIATKEKGMVDQPTRATVAYPNPSQGNVTLEYGSSLEGPTVVRVINANGQVVLQLDQPREAVQTELDLSPFADGIYTIQVTNAQRSTVQRVLLRR